MRGNRLYWIAAMNILLVFLLAVQTTQSTPNGQTQVRVGREGRSAAPPAVESPEIHSDRTVSFRLRTPQATTVHLVGAVLQGKPPAPMTKGDNGMEVGFALLTACVRPRLQIL